MGKYGGMNPEFIHSLVSALVPVDVGDMEMESDRRSALTCAQSCPKSNCRISCLRDSKHQPPEPNTTNGLKPLGSTAQTGTVGAGQRTSGSQRRHSGTALSLGLGQGGFQPSWKPEMTPVFHKVPEKPVRGCIAPAQMLVCLRALAGCRGVEGGVCEAHRRWQVPSWHRDLMQGPGATSCPEASGT